jgi:hypothetical protein
MVGAMPIHASTNEEKVIVKRELTFEIIII